MQGDPFTNANAAYEEWERSKVATPKGRRSMGRGWAGEFAIPPLERNPPTLRGRGPSFWENEANQQEGLSAGFRGGLIGRGLRGRGGGRGRGIRGRGRGIIGSLAQIGAPILGGMAGGPIGAAIAGGLANGLFPDEPEPVALPAVLPSRRYEPPRYEPPRYQPEPYYDVDEPEYYVPPPPPPPPPSRRRPPSAPVKRTRSGASGFY